MTNGLAPVTVGKTGLILNRPEIRSVSSSYILYESTLGQDFLNIVTKKIFFRGTYLGEIALKLYV